MVIDWIGGICEMPLYDYKCSRCEKIIQLLVTRMEAENPMYCPFCNISMERLFPKKGSFKLEYNNKTDLCGWGCDNYESSQYWKAYKEAKERGENVKPADAD